MITNELYKPENFIRNELAVDCSYQYEVLTHHHIDRVVKVFTQAFCRSEPMTHYLQMDEKKYKTFASAVISKAAEDELSIVALDNETIVACAIVEDLNKPGDIPDFDPKFANILALLSELSSDYFKDKKVKDGYVSHLFITAVNLTYRHQGLSRQVNFHAMDLAASQGFDFMCSEFTHFYNEKGTIPHLRNPKLLIGSQIYKDFIFKDKKPFEFLEGGANSYLWEIRKQAASNLNPFFST